MVALVLVLVRALIRHVIGVGLARLQAGCHRVLDDLLVLGQGFVPVLLLQKQLAEPLRVRSFAWFLLDRASGHPSYAGPGRCRSSMSSSISNVRLYKADPADGSDVGQGFAGDTLGRCATTARTASGPAICSAIRSATSRPLCLAQVLDLLMISRHKPSWRSSSVNVVSRATVSRQLPAATKGATPALDDLTSRKRSRSSRPSSPGRPVRLLARSGSRSRVMAVIALGGQRAPACRNAAPAPGNWPWRVSSATARGIRPAASDLLDVQFLGHVTGQHARSATSSAARSSSACRPDAPRGWRVLQVGDPGAGCGRVRPRLGRGHGRFQSASIRPASTGGKVLQVDRGLRDPRGRPGRGRSPRR